MQQLEDIREHKHAGYIIMKYDTMGLPPKTGLDLLRVHKLTPVSPMSRGAATCRSCFVSYFPLPRTLQAAVARRETRSLPATSTPATATTSVRGRWHLNLVLCLVHQAWSNLAEGIGMANESRYRCQLAVHI